MNHSVDILYILSSFYEKLKSQIEPTLSNANDCLAMLGMQGTAVGEAAREAREYQSLAAKYGEEATDSRKKVKAAEFDARMASESAGEEVRKTMKERRAREREAQILVEMQAHAAKAINEENAELKRRNTLLEKENIIDDNVSSGLEKFEINKNKEN